MALYAHLKEVFIPIFIKHPKDKCDGWKFIKTLPAGTSKAHILYGRGLYGKNYFVCMRKDDFISTEELWGKPLGYEYKTLKECEDMAAKHKARATIDSRRINTNKSFDPDDRPEPEACNVYFINPLTGHKVPYLNLRQTAGELGCSYEHLRLALVGGKDSVRGYTIMRNNA